MDTINMLNSILELKDTDGINEVYAKMLDYDDDLTQLKFLNVISKKEKPTIKFIIDYANALGCTVNLSIDCSTVTGESKTMTIVNKVLRKLKLK
jgi:hypothetical protein